MMLRKLRMSVVTLSALSLMAAGVLTVSASTPAVAAQDVSVPVVLEHSTNKNDIQSVHPSVGSPALVPALVCAASNVQEKYEVGYNFTLELRQLREKWKDVVASWTTVPGLNLTNLDVLGEITLTATLPEDVVVSGESYTPDAYEAAFKAANAGSPFLNFIKFHNVEVEGKTLIVELTIPGRKSGVVSDAFNKAEKIVLPTLDDTLYVTAQSVEKHAAAKTTMDVAVATTKGFLDVPEIHYLNLPPVNSKLPLNVNGAAQSTLALTAKVQPWMQVTHVAKDPLSSPALPAAITSLNTSEERLNVDDPDTFPAAPDAAHKKIVVDAGTWSFEKYTSEKTGSCGKRLFTGVWAWTPKSADNQPGDDQQSTPAPQNPGGNNPDPAPQTQQTVTPSVARVVAGKDITFRAEGFLPDSQVTFKVYSDEVVVGTVKAGANGVATIKWTVPVNFAPGTHKVVATSGVSYRAESSFIVDAPAQAQIQSPKGKGSLAATGTSADALIVISLVASAIGAATYGRSARRRG